MNQIINPAPQRAEGPASWLDEVAYVAPMAVFLALTWAGGHWPSLYVHSYVAKTFAAAALLLLMRRRYTRITWDYWWLGIIVGVAGIVQWVGVEEALLAIWPNYPRIPGAGAPFDPFASFSSSAAAWAFIIIRWAGAALVVPFMEELFWRDFLWRTIASPNDFRLARIGEWDARAFIVVLLLFTSVHPQWITAIIWGAMIGALLLYTRSIGACIIAHAVTNFLLGAFVQATGKWYYW